MVADGGHLVNWKNRNISKTVGSFSMNIAVLTELAFQTHKGYKNSNFKVKMVDGRHHKN